MSKAAVDLFPCAVPQGLNPDLLKADFPALSRTINGQPLVWLDSGASAQKPRQVLEAMTRFAGYSYANVNRGVHQLAAESTAAYAAARETVQKFLHANRVEEIIFTKNATEALNLVAWSYGRSLQAGDEILITTLEHHANIVPWQMLAKDKGLVLKVVPITDSGEVRLEDVKALLTPRTKIVSCAHISNVLGTLLPVREIAALAHAAGAICVVDGCQASAHMDIDVVELGADFYAFSAHKLYGPSGIGVLYGRYELLERMPPWQTGGDMVMSVSLTEGTSFKPPPGRFEAGTPPIIEAIGLAAAIEYVKTVGLDRIRKHENSLLREATEALEKIPGLTIYGCAKDKAAIIAFTLKGVHPHDLATILDEHGVAVRAGHHCAEPLHARLGIDASVRATFGLYNTRADIARLVEGIEAARALFGRR